MRTIFAGRRVEGLGKAIKLY